MHRYPSVVGGRCTSVAQAKACLLWLLHCRGRRIQPIILVILFYLSTIQPKRIGSGEPWKSKSSAHISFHWPRPFCIRNKPFRRFHVHFWPRCGNWRISIFPQQSKSTSKQSLTELCSCRHCGAIHSQLLQKSFYQQLFFLSWRSGSIYITA